MHEQPVLSYSKNEVQKGWGKELVLFWSWSTARGTAYGTCGFVLVGFLNDMVDKFKIVSLHHPLQIFDINSFFLLFFPFWDTE